MSFFQRGASTVPSVIPPKRSHRNASLNRPLKQKKTVSDRVVDAVIGLIIALIVVAILYPLWFIVIASFSDPTAVATGQVNLIPKGF
ncbi:MAG: carbohydrate ABC transporter permease, partial [Bifidobacterium crudilactis]|nr:carbohydrate ABC transporter permease [Bifidobacterium crudilactis]